MVRWLCCILRRPPRHSPTACPYPPSASRIARRRTFPCVPRSKPAIPAAPLYPSVVCAIRLLLFVLLRTVSPCRSSAFGIQAQRWCRVFPDQMRQRQGARSHTRLLQCSSTSYFLHNFSWDLNLGDGTGAYSSTQPLAMQRNLSAFVAGRLKLCCSGSGAETGVARPNTSVEQNLSCADEILSPDSS